MMKLIKHIDFKRFKTLSIIFFLFSIQINGFSQGGNTCASAAASPITIPFSSTGTLCAATTTNDYNLVGASCMDFLNTQGPDWLYYFCAPTTGTINIDLTNMLLYCYDPTQPYQFPSLSVWSGCPSSGTCVSGTSCQGTPELAVMADVVAGNCYYILIDDYPGYCPCFDYDINIGYVITPPVQPSCTNMGYDAGSFTGWSGTYGYTVHDGPPGAPTPTYNPVTFTTAVPQHTIMAGAGVDPLGGFPVVCPGFGPNSARLGDGTTAGYGGATLEQTFNVTAANALLTYQYAVVIQDANGATAHTTEQQPFFKIEVFDCAGNPILCGQYLVVGGPGIPGFVLAPGYTDVYYRPWTPVAVDLTPYIGSCATIKFSVGDCSLGAHFSYAYIDVQCSPMAITGPNFVCPGASTTLTAPAGAAAYSWTPGGATTQSITVSPAVNTTYTCTITSVAGPLCTTFLTYDVFVHPPAVVTSTDQTVCAGFPATLTATPTVGGGTFSWAPGGATTSAITVSPAATTNYTVTYTDLNGCTDTDIGTVTVNPLPTIVVNSPSICTGGSVALNASGASTYTWSPGTGLSATTGASVTATPAATTVYTVTGTDVNGCVNSNTSTVTVNPIPVINVNSPSYCSGGSAVLTATGGTTYSWSPGTDLSATTGASVTTTSPSSTTYTVTGTSLGCSNTATSTVTILLAFDATISPAGPFCPGDPSVILSAVDPGGTWSATCGACINSVTGSFDPSLASVGPNTITYTITGACGAVDNEDITINPSADATITPVGPYCTTSPAVILTAADLGGTWSATCGACINGVTGSFDPSLASVGPNTITYTIAGACGDSQTTIIDVQQVTITAPVTDALCFGSLDGTITINAPGATSFSDDAGGSFQASNLFTEGAGTYDLVAVNPIGCQATLTVVINEPPIVTAIPGGQDEICFGACDGFAVVASGGGTGSFTFSWTGPSTGSTALLPSLCAGTYNVTVTDANGCTATATQIINSPPQVIITSVPTTPTLCFGSADGSLTVNATGSAPLQYSINGGILQLSNVFNGLSAGTYTILVQDPAGCTATTTATVTEPTPVTVVAGPDVTICIGASTNLTSSAAGGTGPYNFAWTNNQDATVLFGQNQTVFPFATPTIYTVTVTDANGCGPATDATTVTINPPVAVIANTSQSICPGTSVAINAVGSGGNGVYTYSWTNSVDATVLSGINQTVSPSVQTDYTVTLTDACGTATSTITISIFPLPPVIYTPYIAQGCSPLVVDFQNLTIAGAGATCFWDFGDGTTSTNCNNIHVYSSQGCYDVSLNMVTSDGCLIDTTVYQQICVWPEPQADFTFGPQPTDVFYTEIDFANLTLGGTSYSWDFAGLGTSTLTNPSFVFPESDGGVYTVCLGTVNDYGCMDTTCHDVIIGNVFLIYVPNVFTCEGDGTNDIFLPILQGEDPLSYELIIFNRWGELIFTSNNKYIGWDGTHKGKKSKEDVYVWKIRVKQKDVEDRKQYIGHVTLLR